MFVKKINLVVVSIIILALLAACACPGAANRARGIRRRR